MSEPENTDTTTESSDTDSQPTGEAPDRGTDLDALRSELAEVTARAAAAEKEAERWKVSSRKREERERADAERLKAAKSLEQQVADLQQQMTDRDAADRERSARHALAQLRAEVADAGIPASAVDGFPIDVTKLLDESGQPDDKAIRDAAKSLVKFAGRTTPDPDQGQRGQPPRNDMDTLIRRKAGVIP